MIIKSILIFGAIAIFAGIILALAYLKLKVKDNPVVEKLVDVLPGLNCGACGYVSCHEYAAAMSETMSEERAELNLCRPGGENIVNQISDILGVESEGDSKKVKAVVRCGVKDRKKSAIYEGPVDCTSMNLIGGGMACRYGCLGCGDCARACPFDAITLNENNLPVVNYGRCTGCGLCVDSCPRDIITLKEPDNDEIIYVACMSVQSAKDTKTICGDGCIGCKICERKAPEGMFSVKEDLASVKNQAGEVDIESIKCPPDCIDVLKRNS
jgi:electron transport complex protein RnfB